MKKLLAYCLLIAIVVLPFHSHAACTGSSPTWTTDGNEAADVAECVTAATAGDTINVIAGDGAATYGAAAVTIPVDKPLNIVGPGMDNLTITLSGDYPFTVAHYIGTAELPATSISGFHFVNPEGSAYGAIQIKGQGWRVHHNKHTNNSDSVSLFVETSSVNTGGVAPYGLIDNNIIIDGKVLNDGMGGTEGPSVGWATASGIGTANAVYVEDNTFSAVRLSDARLAMDTNRGGRYVFRYNTTSRQWLLAHGLQDEDERGARSWEIYGNTLSSDTYNGDVGMINLLAGTGMVFFNYMPSTAPTRTYFIAVSHERSVEDARWATVGACDGDSIFDGNDDATGWPCRDQIGTDTDASTWTMPQTSNVGPDQTLSPAYFWSNYRGTGTPDVNVRLTSGTHIKANRDFYNYNTSFNGEATVGNQATGGVGCGALVARPATCTTGVAYWATNQNNCTDLTGYVGDSTQRTSGIATKIEGSLYKCVANAWEETASYTPYDYPHPLRNESETTYTVTVTNSGSGHSASHTGERVVNAGNSLEYIATMLNGWKANITGCGCAVSNCTTATCTCTITPTENCEVTATSSQVQVIW